MGLPAPATGARAWLPRGAAAALALSLVAHAAVLVGYWPGPGAAPAGRPSLSVVTTRLVVPEDGTARSADTQALATAPEGLVTAPDRAPEPLLPAPILVPVPAEAVQTPAPAAQAATTGATKPAEAVSMAAESPAAPSYLPSSGLDVAPRPLDDIEPMIPDEARGRAGAVVLQLFISAQGVVDRAEVLRSNPPGLFDASALAAATRVRFSPGYLGGVPVDSQVTREVTFHGKGGGKDAAGRGY